MNSQVDTTPSIEVNSGGKRRRIDAGKPLHVKVVDALGALIEANDERKPSVMVRGNELVRMTERGELEHLDTDSLRKQISIAAQFEKQTIGGVRPIDPPRDVAQTLAAADSGDYDELPRVDRVVDVPVLDAHGELITAPGHHPASRLYYRPADGLSGVEPQDVSTTDDVDWALDLLLNELLGDFGFDDEASRAHALAMLLQPFVREYIGDNPTPMYGIFAPTPGTGKSFLAQACLAPACGVVPMSPGAGTDDAEWRKVITSALLAGRGAIVFDNLHGTLGSAALASALTTGVWSDRVLGASRMVTLPVRNVWAATANNPEITDEQARRIVPIFLSPGEVRPSDRDRSAFKHPDLPGWARENRRELVRAALTLIEHWRQGPVDLVEGGYVYLRGEGDPRRGSKTLGSYERWASVVGGILEAAGVDGFLSNRERLNTEANEERHEAVQFLTAWHSLGREPLTTRELVELCDFGGELHDHLPVAVAEARSGERLKKLGYWLRSNHGQRIGDLQLLREEDQRHIRRWFVRSTEPRDDASGIVSEHRLVPQPQT